MQISPQNEKFLDAAIASGVFASRDQAIDQAVTLLRGKREALEDLLQHRVPLPKLPSVLELEQDGSVSVRGHRISLHLLLDRIFAGDSPQEIHDWFPSLPRETIDAVVAFASAYPESLRAYFEQEEAIYQLLYEIGRRGPTMEQLRGRWLAKFGKPFEPPCH
jgi:uncharacterized protein (DUF433 family)